MRGWPQKLSQVGAIELDAVYAVATTTCVVQIDSVIVIDENRGVENAPIGTAAAKVVEAALDPMSVCVDEIAEELEGAQRIATAEEACVVSGKVYVTFVFESGRRSDPAPPCDGDVVMLPAH
jgi:hypothetical protein